jgi:hypothetical protein
MFHSILIMILFTGEICVVQAFSMLPPDRTYLN